MDRLQGERWAQRLIEGEAPMRPEPVDPCPADRGWQHELIEQLQPMVRVDESPDIVVGGFAEDLLVHPTPIRLVRHLTNDHWLAPLNMQWQLDPPVDGPTRT